MAANPKIANMKAGPLDGRTVHYAKPGRFAGAVTLCNGRTLAYAMPADPAAAVTCGSCVKAEAAGRIVFRGEN